MTKTNKESKYIVACQNCMLPVSKCKGDCTRKQILKNAAKLCADPNAWRNCLPQYPRFSTKNKKRAENIRAPKHLNGYIEEKDDTFYPTCRFCGKQTLPDAPYLSQDEANEAATIRCDCFEAREYQEKLRKEKERADNIIKLRQKLDDFSEYSASRGVELTGELHDLLLNVGIAIIDGQILKANINVGRIKVSISSNAKSVLTICFTYSDGAKLEV